MKVKELIAKLQKFDGEAEVTVNYDVITLVEANPNQSRVWLHGNSISTRKVLDKFDKVSELLETINKINCDLQEMNLIDREKFIKKLKLK